MFLFFAHEASPGGFYTTGWPPPRGPLDELKAGVGETVLRHPKNVTDPPQASAFDGDVDVASNCGVSKSSSLAFLVESHQTFQLCGAEWPGFAGVEKQTGDIRVVDFDLQGPGNVFHAPKLIGVLVTLGGSAYVGLHSSDYIAVELDRDPQICEMFNQIDLGALGRRCRSIDSTQIHELKDPWSIIEIIFGLRLRHINGKTAYLLFNNCKFSQNLLGNAKVNNS